MLRPYNIRSRNGIDTFVIITRIQVLESFGDALTLRELEQVVCSTTFAIRAAHIEAAEGVNTDQRASAFAIQVKITHMKFAAGLFQTVTIIAEQGTC